ncbi:MAG: hypothetical protein RSE13_23010 [Planktothrix sp. GU0601_MAG3]|nr:MAG: hypothetical protein RSE13_23010 [Planktothrix sp. GU0601_MAG3]
MSIFFVNDGGSAIINIGGFNPPSQELVTQGIVVPPIITNPVLGDVYFDSTKLSNSLSQPQVLLGTSGNDILTGMEGNDTFQGLKGNDLLQGQGGDDILFGGQGNDTLIAGSGNDQLSGDQGQDLLTGNSGNDIFILPISAAVSNMNTVDIITDFIVGEDTIGLTEGLNQNNINLIPLVISGSPGTLISVINSHQFLGFVANVSPGGLINQFITIN